MQLRRFTRLTNGFSKKLVNFKAMVDVFFVWYNCCRVHQTIRMTPAMEAGWTDHVWTVKRLLTTPQLKGEESSVKTCPFCAEDIHDAAIVCKHCGRDLSGKQPPTAITV